jgi:N utilization substance protein A
MRVIVDEDDKSMEIVVPDDQLSLAIGKRGQNVRLASKLSGWHLDVTSETNYNRSLKEAYDSLLKIDGVGEKTALNLYQAGFRSAEEVAGGQISDLVQLRDIGEEKAAKIIENASQYVKRKQEEDAAAAAAGLAAEDSEPEEAEGQGYEAVKEDVTDGQG